MEPSGPGEPPDLLQFLRRLKEVFDVCDQDADGFIRVEHFVALGVQFGQEEESSLGSWADLMASGFSFCSLSTLLVG
uniref:Uncharacterized protein n=1 Tax=Sphaerodactylus townsendi TaxID=933632 RepID=A0ACB8EME8_9SAUR